MNAKLSFKLLSLTLFLPMLSMVAEAASLSPEQALQRVQSSGPVYRMPGDRQLTLQYTGKAAGENVLYVFNSGDNGFIVASADDRMPPLLGYSDKGSLDMENASPEFKWWLSRYTEEAEGFFSSEAGSNYVYSATRSDKESIPVLLSTEWNQDEPYNQDCPTDAGGRCVTGCVATAMAQVINYHAYPVSGTGSHSYIWNGRSLSFDYAGAVFDYGNMLDSYYGDSSDVQKAAVANLMYACGVSVDMDYSSYESGAWDGMVLSSLKEYFNYDTAMQYMMRDFYSNEEWNDLVYAELKERRPVLYSGSSENGGHMFVCDGYQDGYFHMNWGWGGYNDGWFLLSALNPDGQGIGGNEGGFNLGQSVICGVQPNMNTPLSSYHLLATGSYGVGRITGNSMIELYFSNDGGVYNYSAQYIETPFYLKAVSQNGEETLSEGVPLRFEGAFWGFQTLYLNLPSVGEGDYKVYVVFDGPQGQLQQLPVPLQDKDFMNMKVDAEGNVSFFDGSEQPDITVTELTPISDVVARKSVDFNLSVRNSGDVSYSGTVYIRCYAVGSEEIVSECPVQVAVRGGQSLSETVNMVFDVAAGEYELRCFDAFGNPCSGSFPLSVAENPEVYKIVVEEVRPLSDVLSGQPAEFFVSVRNEGNMEYNDVFHLLTYEAGSDTPLYQFNLWVSMEPGETFSGIYTLTYDLPDGDYEMRCIDMFGHPCSETFPFVIGEKAEQTNLVVTDIAPMSQIYAGLPAQFDLFYRNEATVEYSGYIYLRTFKPGSDEPVDEHGFDIYFEPGASSRLGIQIDYDLSAGEYEIGCFDMFGNPCSDLFPFTIKDQSESPTVHVSKLTQLADVVSNEDAEFNFSIQNIGIVNYNGPLFILTYNHDSDEPVCQNMFGVNIDPEVSLTFDITLKYDLPDGDYEQQCFDMFWRPCSDVFPLTIGKRPDVVATGISLDKTEAALTEGESLTLTATISPENATDRTVAWTTSDAAVATVENGVVKAVAPGTAVITASTSNGLTAQCAVTVSANVVDVTGISLDKTEATLAEGETLTLTATVAPENATDRTVTWTTSDAAVATVENGVVKAVAPGSAVITASTSNGLTATCTVTVSANVVEVTGISLDKNEATLTEGETLTLTATVAPENATDRTVTWTTSDAAVATVENGVVKAVAPGTAVITASTSNGLTAQCAVTVSANVVEVTGISLDKTEATLTEGETLTLTATVAPENATDRTVTWTTSDAAVATVENGVVKAVAPGTAVITASTSNGLTATCTVTVEPRIVYATSISLDITAIEAEIGSTFTIIATVLPDDTTDKTVSWSSSDESVAVVDQDGNVTVVAMGDAVITAVTTDGSDLSAQCTVNGIMSVPSLISSGMVDIYTLDGILIRKNVDSEFIDSLSKGTYIIRVLDRSYKIIKR